MKSIYSGPVRAFVATALMAAVLSACGGGGGSTTPTEPSQPQLTDAQKIAALETAGTLPTLDRSASLTGTDADGNGVRDDIDAIIRQRYTAAPQKAAATQYAAVVQSELTVNLTDMNAVKALSARSARAINCLATQFGTTTAPRFSDVRELLASYTNNTKARLLAHLAFSKALDGTVIALPEGNTCE